MSLNIQAQRTWKIDGFVKVEGVIWLFVQGLTAIFDANVFTRDLIGTGQPVFTQLGDVIGNFNFNTKNTVDIYKVGTALISDDSELIGTMLKAIAAQAPLKVQIVQTLVARDAGGVNDRIRITFDGRIMKPEISWLVDVAVDDVVIDGEITNLVSVIRDTNP